MEVSVSNIKLSEKTQVDLDRFAKLTRRSHSFIINEALEHYLQDRMTYLAELDVAVASIDTGPTYPAEEVFQWMRTWGMKDSKRAAEVFDLPKCDKA